jgi:hypothetical protein
MINAGWSWSKMDFHITGYIVFVGIILGVGFLLSIGDNRSRSET